MSDLARRGRVSRRVPSKLRVHATSLDDDALEAIQLFARALARRGASAHAITAAFMSACKGIPQSLIDQGTRASRDLFEAGHALSLWFTDPLYLDGSGQPLPLPIRGRVPSFETLVKRVDSKLDARRVLKYLLRAKGLRKIGRQYAPRSRALDLRGTGGPTHFRTFHTLLALLRTIERNVQPEHQVSSSFEFSAENPRFPLRAKEDFRAKVRQAGFAFLNEMDSSMLSYEGHRNPGEPTIRMGVGVYLFDDSVESKSDRNGKPATRLIEAKKKGRRAR